MSDTLRRALAAWKEAWFKAEDIREMRRLADVLSDAPAGVTEQNEEEKELWRIEGTRHGEFFSLLEEADNKMDWIRRLSSTSSGTSHTPACLIWGDDGQGKNSLGNCTCGAHWNYALRIEGELNEFKRIAKSLLISIEEMRMEGHPSSPYWFGPFSEWDSSHKEESWDQITIEWPDLVTLAGDLRKALDQKG